MIQKQTQKMKKPYLYHKLVGLSALFFLLLQSAFAAEAILLNVTGDVEVSVSGKTQKAKSGQGIEVGASVISRGGIATILFADGKTKELIADKTVKIEPQNRPDRSSPAPFFSRLVTSIAEMTATDKEVTVKGMVRSSKEDQRFHLLGPCNTFIQREKLEFRWGQTAEGIGKSSILIKSRNPKFKYSFLVDGTNQRAALPANAPPLEPMVRYYWKITPLAEADNEIVLAELCWFSILSDPEEAKLKKELAAVESLSSLQQEEKDFLTAHLYGSYRLFSEAIGLAKKYPDRSSMNTLLKQLERRQQLD